MSDEVKTEATPAPVPAAVPTDSRIKRLYTFGGYTGSMSDWARRLGISKSAMVVRLRRHPPEIALSRPLSRSSNRKRRKDKVALVTRAEFVACHQTLTARIEQLEKELDRIARDELNRGLRAISHPKTVWSKLFGRSGP